MHHPKNLKNLSILILADRLLRTRLFQFLASYIKFYMLPTLVFPELIREGVCVCVCVLCVERIISFMIYKEPETIANFRSFT